MTAEEKDLVDSHEIECKELWKGIATAYVSAGNSTNSLGAAEWADDIVKEFNKRYNPINGTKSN